VSRQRGREHPSGWPSGWPRRWLATPLGGHRPRRPPAWPGPLGRSGSGHRTSVRFGGPQPVPTCRPIPHRAIIPAFPGGACSFSRPEPIRCQWPVRSGSP